MKYEGAKATPKHTSMGLLSKRRGSASIFKNAFIACEKIYMLDPNSFTVDELGEMHLAVLRNMLRAIQEDPDIERQFVSTKLMKPREEYKQPNLAHVAAAERWVEQGGIWPSGERFEYIVTKPTHRSTGPYKQYEHSVAYAHFTRVNAEYYEKRAAGVHVPANPPLVLDVTPDFQKVMFMFSELLNATIPDAHQRFVLALQAMRQPSNMSLLPESPLTVGWPELFSTSDTPMGVEFWKGRLLAERASMSQLEGVPDFVIPQWARFFTPKISKGMQRRIHELCKTKVKKGVERLLEFGFLLGMHEIPTAKVESTFTDSQVAAELASDPSVLAMCKREMVAGRLDEDMRADPLLKHLFEEYVSKLPEWETIRAEHEADTSARKDDRIAKKKRKISESGLDVACDPSILRDKKKGKQVKKATTKNEVAASSSVPLTNWVTHTPAPAAVTEGHPFSPEVQAALQQREDGRNAEREKKRKEMEVAAMPGFRHRPGDTLAKKKSTEKTSGRGRGKKSAPSPPPSTNTIVNCLQSSAERTPPPPPPSSDDEDDDDICLTYPKIQPVETCCWHCHGPHPAVHCLLLY